MKKGSIIYFRLLVLIAIFFNSCNNPLHRTYSPATYEEDMRAIQKSNKVSDDDLQLLAKYILIAKLSGNDITGTSYDDIIDKIKSLQQNNDALRNRDAMEKETKRARLSPYLKVNLHDKTFGKKNNKDAVFFTVVFENIGIQKIKTVTGSLAFNDFMEKPIKNLAIFLDEDIAAGQTLTKIYTVDYNNADENDRRIRSKDFSGIKTIWNPEKIIFENGRLAE